MHGHEFTFGPAGEIVLAGALRSPVPPTWMSSLAAPWLVAGRMSLLLGRAARARWGSAGGSPQGPHELRKAALNMQALSADLAAGHGIVIRRHGELPTGPCVLVANHLSYIDTVVLPALTPCAPVSKCEIADWPLIGKACQRMGVLFVDRSCAHSGATALRRALRALEAGVTVVTFPEGTTTTGDRVLPFKRGVFGLARRLGLPVVPVALAYEDPSVAWVGGVPFLGHYLRRVASRPRTPIDVIATPALDARAYESPEALAEAARRAIARRLAALHHTGD